MIFGGINVNPGLLLWVILCAVIYGSFNGEQQKTASSNKSTAKVKSDDFDLPGFGAVIWQSKQGVSVSFMYEDASGNKTTRGIILHKIMKDSKTRFYFEGYCQLRKASRTFNSEKITMLHDGEGRAVDLEKFINDTVGYKTFGSTEVRELE